VSQDKTSLVSLFFPSRRFLVAVPAKIRAAFASECFIELVVHEQTLVASPVSFGCTYRTTGKYGRHSTGIR
jgi:hypothetical protein